MHHFRFCPECGGRLAQQPLRLEPEKKELTCTACGFVFWQNAKPTATAVLENKHGEALLVLRAFDPKKGFWDLPGGFLETEEKPEEGLRRELHEELGVEITDVSFLGIFADRYGEGEKMEITFNVYYRARIASGDPTPASDIADARWFNAASLPEHMAFESNEKALDAWLEATGRAKKYGPAPAV